MDNTDGDFFGELKEWSRRKHTLVEKYLDGATRILGSTGSVVYYVDGFAGKGYYAALEGVGKPEAGSPVRAALLAQQMEQDGRSYRLKCINVEQNSEYFENLTAATANYSDVVTNLPGSFADAIDDIVMLIGDAPAICFIDPFGIKGVSMATIRRLIERGGITDFWIRFNSRDVRRRDGWFAKIGTAAGAERHTDLLCDFYGIEDHQTLHQLLSDETADARVNRAISLYCERLANQFVPVRNVGFAAAYRIGSVSGESKYHLVFGTGNKKGVVLASNIIYDVEKEYQIDVEGYRETRTRQPSLFPQQLTHDDISRRKIETIRDAILQEYAGRRASRIDIQMWLLANGWFGKIKGTHLTKALGEIVDDTKAVKDGNISSDKTSFMFASAG